MDAAVRELQNSGIDGECVHVVHVLDTCGLLYTISRMILTSKLALALPVLFQTGGSGNFMIITVL